MNSTKTLTFFILFSTVLTIGCLENNACSPNEIQACDKTCQKNNDCALSCGCGCISTGERCDSDYECEQPMPCYGSCVCVNGKCTTERNVIEEALEKEDTSICLKSDFPECEEFCELKVEEKINSSLPAENTTLSTDKKVYGTEEKIILKISNKGKNPVSFYKGFVRFAPANDPSWEKILLSHYEDFVNGCEHTQSKDCEQITVSPSEEINFTVYEEKDQGIYSLAVVFNNNSIEYSNAFEIVGPANVSLKTSKKEYVLGEEVNAEVSTTRAAYYGLNPWQIMKKEDDSWRQIKLSSCLYPCNKTNDRCGEAGPCALMGVPFIGCRNLTTKKEFTWNQKEIMEKKISCEEKNEIVNWDCFEENLMDTGRYKIVFEYALECPIKEKFGENTTVHTLETEFEIVPGKTPQDYCEQDRDCLHQDACCHPCGSECVNRDNFIPVDCGEPGEYFCPTELIPSTECVCLNNTCIGIPVNDSFC